MIGTNKRIAVVLMAAMLLALASAVIHAQPSNKHDLHFPTLAKVWDEGIPLGNGLVGALVWQKGDQLRLSLDRADIWDMRPMAGLHRDEFSYKWVQGQVNKKEYKPVQQYFDAPYDREAAPSKIPGGALEFDTEAFGKVSSVDLNVANALCTVSWQSGVRLTTFVHAQLPVGWFRFENVKSDILPQLIPPPYQGDLSKTISGSSVVGNDLRRLEYKQGEVTRNGNTIVYTQEGYGGFKYQITISWKKAVKGTIEGVWSISSQYPDKPKSIDSGVNTQKAIARGYKADFESHKIWWKGFWSKSAISVPDTLLEKQWYLEQYKFGAAARRGAPPISLQAVWTADNGRIPPWKGDYHHDLNTQLSYWPSYSGNHLEEALGYLDHLDENKENYKRYTKLFFGTEGLAVPGVTTLDGTEMGGWIQYSLSPTVSAWLAQHYYLQWRYSMDPVFLKDRAYPWVKEVCSFIEKITTKNASGLRQLPISSSPEINDNRLEAWFHDNTNYDLSLMKFAFTAGIKMAEAAGRPDEAKHWQTILNEFGDYAVTANDELMFAPTMAYNQSHRHFSHSMAIHPLGLIKWEDGQKAQAIITKTLDLLDKTGPDYWCGYSYSWLANLKARAKDGDGAAQALTTFAKAFCLSNSFHANGDQTKSGLSKFTYRPFTLEGNFAFAAGLQEMLIQSYAGFIEIMPAIPAKWGDVSFQTLRTEGAFLVSASRKEGKLSQIEITSEKGGSTAVKISFDEWKVGSSTGVKVSKSQEGMVSLNFKPGARVILEAR
jgi:alpha-L-fucosidase 2